MTAIGPRVVQYATAAPTETLGAAGVSRCSVSGGHRTRTCKRISARRFSRSIEGPAADSISLRSPVRRPTRSAIEARGTARKSLHWSKLVQVREGR